MRIRDILPYVSSVKLAELEVAGLHFDSRKIKKGFLFFAIPGFKEDGSAYLPAAFAAGAVAAVVAEGTNIPSEFKDRCISVRVIRKAMATAAKLFYANPAAAMRVLGVTGTKGKTSTTFLLESILKASGASASLIGGVECRLPSINIPSKLTTLDSLDLQEFLARARSENVNAVSMEVSSHALSLDRVWGMAFAGAIFTNLSEDHLDFYKGMDDYFAAKKILFNAPYLQGPAASNIEDAYGKRLVEEVPADWITFGLHSGDVFCENLNCSDRGLSFDVVTARFGKFKIESTLAGEFNVINILGAVALSLKLGISTQHIQTGVRALKVVPGRMERVETSLPFSVFVDYAHMGAALDNVLRSLRPLCKQRLILVAGAGGDRPVERRTQLGSVAAKRADYTWITSDNPRTEEPKKILGAVEAAFVGAGGESAHYCVLEDRRAAIEGALHMAKAGDIVCIAGKGHESGQIIGTTTYPFDDRIEARKVLEKLEG